MKKYTLRNHFIESAEKAHDSLADYMRGIPERGNLRFLRHATNLKVKLWGFRGPITLKLSENQISTLEYALSKYPQEV